MDQPVRTRSRADHPEVQAGISGVIESARAEQRKWSATPIRQRLDILRRFRHALADTAMEIAATVPCELPGSLHRSIADTLVAEVLPLAEACRFLERAAAVILGASLAAPDARPFWLRSVATEIRREALGIVLIIGPGNYPLLLPGVQALQALAAGNAVLWKPAPGGAAVANACRLLLVASGIAPSLIQVLDPTPEAGVEAIRAGVDKVFLTGSVATGRSVLRELAERLTPSVVELSGCDSVFILKNADLKRATSALTFGLRFNGSATCMAPRRVFVAEEIAEKFIEMLADSLASLSTIRVPLATHEKLLDLMADAEARGGSFRLNGVVSAAGSIDGAVAIGPTLITGATPEMRIMQADLFAPVLSIMRVSSHEEALAANAACPYALTASIFGSGEQVKRLAADLPVGTVLINDIVVSTADPQASFGGRKQSGFGATRGREGLLEMTTIKTVQVQSAKDLRAYSPAGEHHAAFVGGYLQAVHGGSWRRRRSGAADFLRAMMKLK